ncbi:MAG: MarC family protein [Bacteroidia bacterium]
MSENFAFALLAFTSFFTLMNPIGVMPVFMTMTGSLNDTQRRHTAQKAVVVAFATLIIFAFSGQLLFKFFGISADSFRVVGGIIFFLMGQDMLHARIGKIKVTEMEIKEYVTDISITPLAIPMICGPGAITNAIVLMEDAETFSKKAILFGIMFLVCLITFLTLWSSSRFINLLGDTGNKILMRLMGLIVMVIAVEFFFSGLSPILRRILKME